MSGSWLSSYISSGFTSVVIYIHEHLPCNGRSRSRPHRYLPSGTFISHSLFRQKIKKDPSIFQIEFIPTLRDKVSSLNWKQYAMMGAVIIDVKLVVSGWLHEEESRDLLSHAAIGLALVYATNHFSECDLHDRLKEHVESLEEKITELEGAISKFDANAKALLLEFGLNIQDQKNTTQLLFEGLATIASEQQNAFTLRLQALQTQASALAAEVGRLKRENDRNEATATRLEQLEQRVTLSLDPPQTISIGPLALTYNQ